MALDEFNDWIEPELGLTVSARHMDMRTPLFSGEKEKPVSIKFEDRRTHVGRLRLVTSPFNLLLNKATRRPDSIWNSGMQESEERNREGTRRERWERERPEKSF
jgi:hypothetical protein